jgi:hypothetical protein
MAERSSRLVTRIDDAQVRAAHEAAALAIRRAHIVMSVARAKRESALSAQCAWCGRFRFDDLWITGQELPAFARSGPSVGQTHGICQQCLDELCAERSGREPGRAA